MDDPDHYQVRQDPRRRFHLIERVGDLSQDRKEPKLETIKDSFLDRLAAVRELWENCSEPLGNIPVVALAQLAADPVLLENEALARQMFQLLVAVYSKVKLKKLDSAEESYCKGIVPHKYYYEYCNKHKGLTMWSAEVFMNWPDPEVVTPFVKTLCYTFEHRFERWYKASSCETFKGVVLRMIEEAELELTEPQESEEVNEQTSEQD